MGFFSKFFVSQEQPKSASMTLDEAIDIAGDYGQLLDKRSETKRVVDDCKRLPYPKSKIKEVLLTMLKTFSDEHIRDQIQVAFLSLAYFQDDFGGSELNFPDPSDINTESIRRIAAEICSQADRNTYWLKKVETEKDGLVAELANHGYLLE